MPHKMGLCFKDNIRPATEESIRILKYSEIEHISWNHVHEDKGYENICQLNLASCKHSTSAAARKWSPRQASRYWQQAIEGSRESLGDQGQEDKRAMVWVASQGIHRRERMPPRETSRMIWTEKFELILSVSVLAGLQLGKGVMIRDDFSRESWTHLHVKKEDAHRALKCFFAHTSTDVRGKISGSDGWSEFRSPVTDVYIDDEIKSEYTEKDPPRQNGSIERALSIVDSIR